MMEDGWPLGLQLLNARDLEVQLRGPDSVFSFSTLFTSTAPASTSSSFSFESTKTPYLYHRRRTGVTLRSLLNTPSTLHLSINTSTSSPPPQQPPRRRLCEIGGLKKSHVTHKPKSWFHSLCSKPPVSEDSDYYEYNKCRTATGNAQLSLSHLLEQERVMSIRRGLTES